MSPGHWFGEVWDFFTDTHWGWTEWTATGEALNDAKVRADLAALVAAADINRVAWQDREYIFYDLGGGITQARTYPPAYGNGAVWPRTFLDCPNPSIPQATAMRQMVSFAGMIRKGINPYDTVAHALIAQVRFPEATPCAITRYAGGESVLSTCRFPFFECASLVTTCENVVSSLLDFPANDGTDHETYVSAPAICGNPSPFQSVL